MAASLDVFQPAVNYDDALTRALKYWGVDPEYYDIWGRHHVTSQEVAKRILNSLGVTAETAEELNTALEQALWNEWSTPVRSTVVLSIGAADLPIHVPAEYESGEVAITFSWEDGSTASARYEVRHLRTSGETTVRGRGFRLKQLPFPADKPLGYHRIAIEFTAGSHAGPFEAALILCPDRAWYPHTHGRPLRAAGIAASLYGLRSRRNWGVGDFTDLAEFANWVHQDLGGSFISLNPLHAIPNRQPYNTSPYLPMSSFYKNPLYLDVEAIDEWADCPTAQKLLASPRVQTIVRELRDAKYVEYERVWTLKQRFLKLLFRQFLREHWNRNSARAQEFRQFVEKQGALLDRYAVYSALDEALHKRDLNLWIWPDWPDDYRDPDSPVVLDFAARHWRLVLFYKFLQWQIERQLGVAQKAAKDKGLTIGLYHDLALATDRCGSDLWAHGPYYIGGCRVGAPPDDFSPKGQDWAFPPPNTVRHRDNGYQLFIRSIRRNIQHGGALRIDHVMRFFRLFWIPEGFEASDGTYVRENYEDLLHILALESVRNRVLVVGEDLGTVEPSFREVLQKFGILSYRLLYFERHQNGDFKTFGEYPSQALISVSTHDLPTLAGFWTNRDIEARKQAGLLYDEANYRQQIEARVRDKQQLLDVFHKLRLVSDATPRSAIEIPEFTGELHNAAVGFLASSPCDLMCLNQEDLLKETDQQNLPGSTAQYPNWRHKMRFNVEDLRTDPLAVGCARMFRTWLEKTGRLG